MTALHGVLYDLDEAAYHARPELSSSKARDLLRMTPKAARHEWSQPQEPKAAFDLGTAVHSKVLGIGAETVAIPVELLAMNGAASTAAAKAWIEEARAEGKTPVKVAVLDEVNAMAESVLAHPMARFLLEQDGHPEASVFSTDPDTEVDLRARFDFLPALTAARQVAVDLKTTDDASRSGFARTAAKWRYDVQRAHYIDALEYTGRGLEGFAFVVVETAAPYQVAVRPLDPQFEEIGVADARRARTIYRRCVTTNEWPGYADGFEDVMPPFWLIAEFQENHLD